MHLLFKNSCLVRFFGNPWNKNKILPQNSSHFPSKLLFSTSCVNTTKYFIQYEKAICAYHSNILEGACWLSFSGTPSNSKKTGHKINVMSIYFYCLYTKFKDVQTDTFNT